MERDVYGNEVGVLAKRVPVAYLLVDVPCGVAGGAGAADPMFNPRATFPPANRPLQHQLQTLRALHAQLQSEESFLEAVSDLHVLLYLGTNEALPLDMEALGPLLDAVRARDAQGADTWRREPHHATLDHLLSAAAEHDHHHHHHHHPTDSEMRVPPGGTEAGGVWTCPLCTFHNAAHHDACEMCAMPSNAM